MNKPHLLMLAYYFPPDSSSGTFRSLYFANHLSKMDIKITVLTAKEQAFLPTQSKDGKLLLSVDPGISVIRTGVFRPREALLRSRELLRKLFSGRDHGRFGNARTYHKNQTLKAADNYRLNDIVTDLLASPDPQVGWIPFAALNGKRYIIKNDVDAIYATGSPWSSFLLGAILKKLTDKPLLLDFRDPWVENPGFSLRTKPAARLEKRMEAFVLKKADAVIANTEELRRSFLKRCSFLKPDRVHTITNGFENYIKPVRLGSRSKVFTITHAGSLYFSRNPKPLLEALCKIVNSGRIAANKIKLLLLGGIEIQDEDLEKLLSEEPISKIVESTPRIAHSEALHRQLASDALLLIQPGFPLQVPRKLYEYMAMRLPVLAITEPNSATARIVDNYHLGYVVQNDSYLIEDAVMSLYQQWCEHFPMEIKKDATLEFLNERLSRKVSMVVNSVLSQRSVIS